MPQPEIIATLEKWCRECYTRKPVADFYRDRSKKDGHNNICKPCYHVRFKTPAQMRQQRLRGREHYKRNPLKRRDYTLRAKYGITLEDYNGRFEAQNKRCAICYTDAPNPHWALDHCHETNVVRGILCHPCNTLLGHAKDSVETLQSAIKYLINLSPQAPQ